MSFAQTLRTAVPLIVGVALGGIGSSLFLKSLPGAEGSPEKRVAELEVELKKANNQIAAYEEKNPRRRRDANLLAGARQLMDDVKAGNNVNPDDILAVLQPSIRELSPIFDRIRVKQEKARIEAKTGELARKYDLTPQQQERLEAWYKQKAKDDAKSWSDLVGTPGTTFEDLARESMTHRPDDGLDQVMEGMLSGEKLTDYKTTRMTEKASLVERHADTRVQRLSGIVELDDAQRDQAFGIFARSSPDYDPAMKLEGIGGDIGATPGGASRDAMLSVLRPEQREKYEVERQRRRAEAEKEMNEIGLTLPSNWDLLDQADF
ncbi:hypothetical protein [Luteolibacter luteus]|uniref:Uncharacterized protein n=1 Tax=Luteolibacter luteus TaxID=2728835 RepID=A0A858RDS7_9BACT|nr:hypothetical protein [Luteolibacter luteus]QJE94882.1 hypothetical protein HHL09_03505 [Luteolibacter luteus]